MHNTHFAFPIGSLRRSIRPELSEQPKCLGCARNINNDPMSNSFLGRTSFLVAVRRQFAAAYALGDKMDAANSALAKARRLNPKLTIKWRIEHGLNLQAYIEGLRKAGLPEE
jgi:hypothetical protein